MNPLSVGASAIGAIQKIADFVKLEKKLSGNVSLTEITQAVRVEPITIISNDCVNLEYMPDVMQACQSLFSGYYLQAVSLVTTIKGIKVARTLDKLNPNSSVVNKSWMYGYENMKFSLPTVNKPQVGIENVTELVERDNNTFKVTKDDIGAKLGEASNLSVGKMLNVTIQQDETKINVPVSIRLLVNAVPESSIVSMLTMMSRDTTLSERWHAYRSGRISFWKDLILANDIIKDAKKIMQNDKEGVITEIFQRSSNAKLNSVFGSGGLNLASASNIYVISKEVADQIERKLGSKLSNYKTREELLKSGYTMILVVVDKTWERVTFYHRGINLPTSVGIKDIKIANKGNGPDVMEIMKALMLGNQPSF